MKCNRCESSNFTKAGTRNGVQQYKCKECSRKFISPLAIKLKKLTVDECLKQCISDSTLKQEMIELLSFFRELKMNPVWYNGSSYRCNHKGKRVAYINFGEENRLRIRVCMTNYMHTTSGDMDSYVKMLSNEMKDEYQNYLNNLQPCEPCPSNGCKDVCFRSRIYDIYNPTQEQFYWIKKFVLARMKFIDNAAV